MYLIKPYAIYRVMLTPTSYVYKKQPIVSILEALSADYMSSANNNNNHELAQ